MIRRSCARVGPSTSTAERSEPDRGAAVVPLAGVWLIGWWRCSMLGVPERGWRWRRRLGRCQFVGPGGDPGLDLVELFGVDAVAAGAAGPDPVDPLELADEVAEFETGVVLFRQRE